MVQGELKKSVIHFETRRLNKARWVSQAQTEQKKLIDWITGTLNQRCHDYNTRAMRQRKERVAGPVAGKAENWLKVAGIIAREQVNSTVICRVLGISRNTLTRHLADMEQVYGLVTEYVRPDGQKTGWYEIRDWGVLNGQEVAARYYESASSRRSASEGERSET